MESYSERIQKVLQLDRADILEFGCNIYSIFTDGENPFGDENREIFKKYGLYDLSICDDESIQQLVAAMLDGHQFDHPMFWSSERVKKYLDKKRGDPRLEKIWVRPNERGLLALSCCNILQKMKVRLRFLFLKKPYVKQIFFYRMMQPGLKNIPVLSVLFLHPKKSILKPNLS